MSVVDYLNNCINKEGDILKLLDLLLIKSESKSGAIFKFNSSFTSIITKNIYSNLNFNNNDIENFKINNLNDIQTKQKFKYCISIPIFNNKKKIGLVILFDRENDYNEEIITEITTLLTLVQFYILTLDTKKIIDCKDLFLANMSHEIRTPLNGVIGYNQLLLQTELTSTQQNYLQNMNKCSIQLMQIINDILDFSKLSSGKMNISNDCFNPKEIINSAYTAVEQKFRNKKQRCIFSIDKNIPKLIISDKQKLTQILVNLLSNAHKYSDIKKNTVISMKIDKNNLIISVKDNGIGIDEKNYDIVFKAFERIKNKNIVCSGTGLGLAVSKKLANLLGGDITISSKLGYGTKFTVITKFKNYQNNYISFTDKEILKNKIILIVDDNADNRIFLSELIFSWNMVPIVCASALEALRMILGNRYDFSLAIIDICMPGTTGPELAQQIKEERPLLPLIAISSLDYYVNSSNFNSILSKPINEIQLLDNIYSILNKNPSIYLEDKKINVCSPSSNFDYNRKILIAEDIKYNRNLLLNMLQMLGYNNIELAENGEETWKKLSINYNKNNPYDILLLDLKMPKVDGYEIIDKIKKENWILPKIIVVTASIMEEDREKCKIMGAKYFLNKPINIKNLKEIMLHVSNLL